MINDSTVDVRGEQEHTYRKSKRIRRICPTCMYYEQSISEYPCCTCQENECWEREQC